MMTKVSIEEQKASWAANAWALGSGQGGKLIWRHTGGKGEIANILCYLLIYKMFVFPTNGHN